jgi:hypothetical protein
MTKVVIVGEVYTSPSEPPGLWPGGGGGEHPGNRPPGSGNYPTTGPVPPGRPTDPGYGQPDWGGRPSNRPPGSGPGGRIDNSLPEGEPVPPDAINPPLPDPPEEYADKVIVAIKKPNEDWRVTAYEADAFPGQGLPPAPEPK